MMQFFKKKSTIKAEEKAVKKAINKVIDQRTHYGISGHPHVALFENTLSEKLGNIPVVAVNSGTDALVLALKALGVSAGDEVIAPAYSFISTASPIVWLNATPVFADINPQDYAIDPKKIEEKITQRTKVIIVTHLFGQPALGMEKILAIAKMRNLFVVEDAAQSFGARIKINGDWKTAGTIGDIGCYSFSSTKPFAAPGNGGAVMTKNKLWLDAIEKMRYYGARKHYMEYPIAGVNSKMHDIQAAALLAKLPFLEHWMNHRKNIATHYKKSLAGLADIITPDEYAGTERTFYRYVIRTESRDKLYHHLIKAAQSVRKLVPSINYPVPLPYFEVFKKITPGTYPIADKMSKTVISLPITNYVSLENAHAVSDSIKTFFKNSA